MRLRLAVKIIVRTKVDGWPLRLNRAVEKIAHTPRARLARWAKYPNMHSWIPEDPSDGGGVVILGAAPASDTSGPGGDVSRPSPAPAR